LAPFLPFGKFEPRRKFRVRTTPLSSQSLPHPKRKTLSLLRKKNAGKMGEGGKRRRLAFLQRGTPPRLELSLEEGIWFKRTHRSRPEEPLFLPTPPNAGMLRKKGERATLQILNASVESRGSKEEGGQNNLKGPIYGRNNWEGFFSEDRPSGGARGEEASSQT